MKIAIIEDNDADAKILGALLKDFLDEPYQLFENLADIQNPVTGFDIIFCDLNLPKSWGERTVRRAKYLFPNSYIVVMTGLGGHYLTGRISKNILSWGADEVISKEILSPSLLEFIFQTKT